MTAVVVPDAGTDPGGFLLAVGADAVQREREQGYRVRHPKVGEIEGSCRCGWSSGPVTLPRPGLYHMFQEHACLTVLPWAAQVALWRGIAERHVSIGPMPTVEVDEYDWQDCRWCGMPWQSGRGPGRRLGCPDLLAAVAAAQAYLTGAGG